MSRTHHTIKHPQTVKYHIKTSGKLVADVPSLLPFESPRCVCLVFAKFGNTVSNSSRGCKMVADHEGKGGPAVWLLFCAWTSKFR